MFLLCVQTRPLKLYYVMYTTSKQSSAKHSCNEGIVSCGENFQQTQENADVNDKVVDEELAKQSMDLTCQPADDHSVNMNKLVSAADADATDVNSNVEVLTVAMPDTATESDNLGTEETANMSADEKVRPVKCEAKAQAADDELLHCVSSALGMPCTTAHVAASTDPANDDSNSNTESVADDDTSQSVTCCDSIPQSDVSSELTGEEEKIGFEPDAITATEPQWPTRPTVVERRVKRLQKEVRRLMFDENGSGMKRELRKSGRVLRKIRRSPLQRLRSMVSLHPLSRHPNKLSSRIDNK